MEFNQLKHPNKKKLEATDLKLIRVIEDIINVQGIREQLPQVVQDLIKEREELRTGLGGEDNG